LVAQTPPPQPNQRIFVPRPGAPPAGRYDFEAESQEFTNTTRQLRGHAKIETDTMLVQADEIDFNTETHDLRARGSIYYHNFARNEQLWADRVDYNTESETGTFYRVRGQANAQINARPGLLTSNQTFYFEGEWAERQEDRYILHNGFITNCKMPNPWWRLRGPKFDIEPGQRAIAYHSVFWVRQLPLFFTPYFYKSLEKVPRKSGFLIPSFGNSSLRGPMLGVGYFWAINRSYDVTYRLTEYTARGEAHHVDFRGKPRPGTDYDAILFAVHDRGITQAGGAPPLAYSGESINIAGKSDLGDGWNARGAINYISSFRFRQQWSESFNEAVGSEVHSVGFLDKNWSDYTFNVIAARLENFQSTEIQIVNPVTLASTFETNAVTIRKLPEAEFTGREHQIWKNVPIWFSFDTAAGLLYRSEPLFNSSGALVEQFQTGELMNRVNFAPKLSSEFHWGDFHVVPHFAIEETYYAESQGISPSASQALNQPIYQVLGTSLARSARDFSADFIFPSLARVFQKKTIFGDKLKHVIEARATYRYVTGIGEDFNQFIRFDQTDILSNTNELQYSLTNRVYARRGDHVDEIFTWQLWQARYFDPTFGGALVPGQRNVFLSTADLSPYAFLVEPRSSSPVVSVLQMKPFGRLGFEWRADYDHRRGEITNSTISVDYRWSKYFVSVGHNQVHTDPILSTPANQFRFRAGFGDTNHRGWNAGVDGIYDALKGVLQYQTTQVTYNTDCCGISVQYRLFNIGTRNDSQFRVSFSVANIGSFGTLRRQDRIF
jgi:LPS-assembly protein